MKRISGVLLALAVLFSATIYAQPNRNSPISERLSQSAAQRKRVALVIGNNDYRHIPRLKNAANDAREMAKVLRELRFEVSLKVDVETREEMDKLITEWSPKIPNDGVALFYYSGHGAQVDGTNYLFPIAAKDPFSGNVKENVKQQAQDLDLVLRSMTTPDSHLNIIIIDACRTRLKGLQGLAAVIGSRGTYIAYATSPGQFASDGDGENGLFTGHLLKNIRTPDLKIEDLFKRVRREVTTDKTNGIGQLPWDASSLLTDFCFNPTKQPEGDHTTPPSNPKGPTIRITDVPIYDPIGGPEFMARIEGEIAGVEPKVFRVVLYSWTDKWYIQPTQASPFTEIGQDGRWSTDIHRGARYAALLVKPDFKPQNIVFNLPSIGGDVVAVTTEVGKKQ